MIYLFVFFLFLVQLAAAITVTSNADSGAGTLRQAILDANASPQTITFNLLLANKTIVLTGNPLEITGTYTIDGANGGVGITVSGGSTVRPFIATAGSPTISNITITNGKALGGTGGSNSAGGAGGGGAGLGGAVFADSTITLSDVLFQSNNATGGTGGSNASSNLVVGGAGGGGLGGAGGAASGVTMTELGGGGGGGIFPTNIGVTASSNTGAAGSGGGGAGGNGGGVPSAGNVGSRYGGGGGAGGNSTAGGLSVIGGAGSYGGGGGGEGDSFDGPGTSAGGGAGGFGGGGGGVSQGSNGPGGIGGFGGGTGGSGSGGSAGNSGGGGGGLGGALFISNLGTTTLTYTTTPTNAFQSNTVAVGAAGTGGGGATAAAAGLALGSDIFLEGGATLAFNLSPGVDLTISTAIESNTSGSKSTFQKTGAGTLTLSGTNNFFADVQMNAGILNITSDANLGASTSTLSFNGGTLKTTGTFTIPRTQAFTGSGTIETASGTLTLSSASSGSGGLTKTGAGTLLLTSVHAYSGPTSLQVGTLSLSGAGSIAASSSVAISSGAIVDISAVTTGSTLTNVSGAGDINIGTKALTIAQGTNGTLTGVIGSGTGSLTKTGAAVLTLSGANTYIGVTNLNVGSIGLGAAGAKLGSGAGALNMATGTVLSGDAVGIALTNPIVITGVGFLNATSGNSMTLSGVVSGDAVTKASLGTVILSGTNTYTGVTTVSAGILNIQNNTALGGTAGTVTVASSAELQLQGDITVGANPLSLNGTGTGATGALLNVSGTNSYAGAIVLGEDTTIGSTAGTLTLGSGGITGAQALTFGGAGNTTVSGVIGATVASVTKIEGGTLTLSGANLYTGATTISVGTLALSTAGSIVSTSVAIGTGAIVDISAVTTGATLNTVSGAGNIAIGAKNLTVNQGSDQTLSGVISGSGAVTKSGSSVLTLSGTNTYTGATSVTAGTLALSGSGIISSSSSVAVDGTLNISGTSGSNIKDLSGGGSVVLGSNTLTVQQISSTSFSGVISGNGILSKTGVQALSIGGINTYAGGTNIGAGGAINLNTSVAKLGDALGSINMAATAILATDPSITPILANPIALAGAADISVGAFSTLTLSGAITGASGSITASSAGVLTLTSSGNTYAGGTTINLGTVALSGSGVLLPAGAVTVNNSSSFIISGISGAIVTIGDLTTASGTTVALGAKTLTLGSSGSTSITGAITGTGGSIIKQGTGTVTLTNSNSYTAATTINAGAINIQHAQALGGSVAVANGAQLQIQGGIAAQANNLTLNGFGLSSSGAFLNVSGANSYAGNIVLATASSVGITTGTLTLTGVISGSTSLDQVGAGTLTLTNSNTYTGVTTISAGTLSIASGSNIGGATAAIQLIGATLSATGNVVIPGSSSTSGSSTITTASLQTTTLSGTLTGANLGVLTLSGAGTNVLSTISVGLTNVFTVAGSIGGSGALTKIGSGTLELTGPNSYSGGTTVTEGTLLGNTTSLQGSIANNATVTFNQASSGTYASGMSGSGTLTKTGSGALTFTGNSTAFSGATEIQAGGFKLNGSLGGITTLSSGAQVSGSGTFGSLINSGTVTPGNSIGTLYVSGDYTQAANGLYTVEIDSSGNSDKIAVTGIAHLNGTVGLAANPGFYTAGTTFQIMTAGLVDGSFANLIENEVLDYQLVYSLTDVKIYISQTGALLPVPLSSLTGNAKSVGDYLFVPGFVTSNVDLFNVESILLGLSPAQFVQGLTSIAPSQISGLPMLELENNSRMIESYKARIKQYKYSSCAKATDPKKVLKSEVWIDPIGFGYLQRGIGEQYGFHADTYGFSIGGQGQVLDQFVIGGGGSYSYSHVHWFEDQGSADSNAFYFGPFFAWTPKNFTLETAMLASVNFYDVNRNIVFPGLFRTATHDEIAWNLVNSIDADYRISDPKKNFFIDPFLSLVFVQSFHSTFTETGACSLDLNVQSIYAAFFRSILGVNLGREVCITPNFALTPSILVSWMQTVQLANKDYTAKLENIVMPTQNFAVYGYDTNPSQLNIGGNLKAKLKDQGMMSAGYTASIGRHNIVQEIRLQFEYAF